MAHMTAEGKRKSSKFRANRSDREHAKMREPGERAEADEMQAKPEGNPEEHEPESPAAEAGEEMIHPDIHEEIKSVMAQHGPAHTVNSVHDHEGMRSHVHSVHADGHEHHADHEGEEHVKHAHEHAGHAAGMTMPEQEEAGEGEYPQGHKSATADDEEGQYSTPL